ncbi:hypothetical protein ROHU_012338 [Labeo rohita]|uniref:Uncharacterized protein n=1 Tax=Labeo rohita TaxID=84645 RepID=A0A498LDY9_LABRO|nr:hypothetical protein ROHU_012338 [Labeo rohita]
MVKSLVPEVEKLDMSDISKWEWFKFKTRQIAVDTVKHNQIGNYLLTEELPAASLDPQVEFDAESVYQISGSVKPAIPRITGDGHSTIGSQSLRAFFKAIPPSTYFVRGEGGYSSHDQACILPMVRVTQKCLCEVPSITVSPGKAVILISINGNISKL